MVQSLCADRPAGAAEAEADSQPVIHHLLQVPGRL